MKPFDAYEIHGCHRLDAAGNPARDGAYTETCPESQAMFWTLYGHIPDEGVMAIGDFISREAAVEVYCRITGGCVNQPLLMATIGSRAACDPSLSVTGKGEP